MHVKSSSSQNHRKEQRRRSKKWDVSHYKQGQLDPSVSKLQLLKDVVRSIDVMLETHNVHRVEIVSGRSTIRISISSRKQSLEIRDVLLTLLEDRNIVLHEIAFPDETQIYSPRGFLIHMDTSDNEEAMMYFKNSSCGFNVQIINRNVEKTEAPKSVSKSRSSSAPAEPMRQYDRELHKRERHLGSPSLRQRTKQNPGIPSFDRPPKLAAQQAYRLVPKERVQRVSNQSPQRVSKQTVCCVPKETHRRSPQVNLPNEPHAEERRKQKRRRRKKKKKQKMIVLSENQLRVIVLLYGSMLILCMVMVYRLLFGVSP